MNSNNLEIIVDTKELVHVLTIAGSVVEKRNVIAELGNIKMLAINGKLEVAATDMELYLSQTIGAQIFTAGATTVASKLLADIVKKIPDKEIRIKHNSENDQLELIGKKCFFSLPTLPPEQFPEIDIIQVESELSVLCADLARLIDYTQFAMSTEETRYNLNGIYLHIKDKELYAAATDGHRLSVTSVAVEQLPIESAIILPRKTSQELVKIIKDSKYINSTIQILFASNKVKFICNNIVIVSKLIDGQFPEYSSFIPTESNYKLIINPKILADVIDRVATVTIDKFRAIKMIMNNKSIEVSASGETRGLAKEQIASSEEAADYCVFNGEEEITIGFNPKYLSDVLNIVKADLVEIYFQNSSAPILIKTSVNASDQFVVMPVKV